MDGPLDQEPKTLDDLYEIQMSLFVQMSRVYDVLTHIARNGSPEDFVEMMDNHEKGIIGTSLPKLNQFGADYEEEDREI